METLAQVMGTVHLGFGHPFVASEKAGAPTPTAEHITTMAHTELSISISISISLIYLSIAIRLFISLSL